MTDVIVGPPEDSGDSNTAYSHKNADQPWNKAGQPVHQANDDHREDCENEKCFSSRVSNEKMINTEFSPKAAPHIKAMIGHVV